jgi:hypothetical protein
LCPESRQADGATGGPFRSAPSAVIHEIDGRQHMKSISILLVLSLGSLQAEVRVAEEMFRKAVKDGDLNAIELLLSSGFNPNLTLHGCTPLYFAMQSNQIDVIRLLLAGHADPNEAGMYGQPFLQHSSSICDPNRQPTDCFDVDRVRRAHRP